jgi:hypothetical protein
MLTLVDGWKKHTTLNTALWLDGDDDDGGGGGPVTLRTYVVNPLVFILFPWIVKYPRRLGLRRLEDGCSPFTGYAFAAPWP